MMHRCIVVLVASIFAISVSHAQNIHIAQRTIEARALLRIDSANWNEAWIEIDGANAGSAKVDTSSFRVTEEHDTATLVSVDSIGFRFSSKLSLSFVLDNSGSMFHSYDSLTSYCDRFIDSLPKGVKFQAVTFDNEDRSESHLFTKRSSVFIAQSGFVDSAAQVKRFWHFFDTIRTRYTPLYDAIQAALTNIQSRREAGDTLRNDVLIVVTDGEDNASGLNIETLDALLRVSHVRMFAINYRIVEDERLLWATKRARGDYYFAEDLHDLRKHLYQIAGSMTRLYHLRYLFPSLGPSTFHK